MLYRGGYYIPYWDYAEVLSSFLKEALLRSPAEFPARGPEEFSMDGISYEGKSIDGKLLYLNQTVGNIGHFVGKEFIYWKNNLVFYHDYVGGTVRNKYFPSKILTGDREHEDASNDKKALDSHPDLKFTNPPR